MLSLKCKNTKLEIHENKLIAMNKTIYISEIMSLHTKNDDASSLFLLKIKLDESVILEFESMHLRELIKNIILDRIKLFNEVKSKILECNSDFKKAFKNLKGILDEQEFIKMYCKGTYNTMILNLFSWSKKIDEITNENFFRVFNQTLLDVFITMNCSIDQFYNLLTTSYFYNIKNAKNSLDRLLNENLREKNNLNIENNLTIERSLNYATRINSYSLLNLSEIEESNIEIKPRVKRIVEFEPVFPFTNENLQTVNAVETEQYQKVDSIFSIKELKFSINVKNQENTFHIPFDKADFEAAKELCKVAFMNQNEETDKFTSHFIKLIEGKYGKEALKYVERLIPSFYKKKIRE